jgi:hypothetical protein
MTVDPGPGEVVREYYDALRAGEPLAPFFESADRDGETVVKFGISETLRGEAVAEGLREQTATTADWRVDSRELAVVDGDDWASFTDEVFLAWTDTERRIRYEFDTRWSGALRRRTDGWRFVAMHVSTAGGL